MVSTKNIIRLKYCEKMSLTPPPWGFTPPSLFPQGITPPMLVFVQSIERAKELFHELIYDGINVDVIHAERTQAQRENVIRSFRAGKVCQCEG